MASYVFASKAIIAKPLSDKSVRAYVLNAVKATAKDITVRLEQITSTWTHKPSFYRPIIRYSGGDAYVDVGTHDDIFRYLDEGTRIRWAVTSRDWQSKTMPGGGYQSGPGRGYIWLKGRSKMTQAGIGAQPGIEARNWTLQLQHDASISLAFRLEAAIAMLAI